MEIDSIITSLARHEGIESRYKEEIHKKQRQINQNSRNIMDYKKRISNTQNISTKKSYYSKIASLENNNAKLQREVSNLLRKSMVEQKEIRRLNSAED